MVCALAALPAAAETVETTSDETTFSYTDNFGGDQSESTMQNDAGTVSSAINENYVSAENPVNAEYELVVGNGDLVSTTLFSADHYMTGLFSEITQGFNTGDWEVHDASLTLTFSTTQLVSQYLSTITISINGVRFYSETVPVTDGLRRQLSIQIPAEDIVEGYNVIAIEGYIRTYSGLPCVDDVTAANWLNVFRESYIEIAYQPLAPCTSIDEFYTCFTSIEALENGQSAVVLDTDYDDDELTAALITLAGVSRQATTDYQNIELLTSISPGGLSDKQYVIYITKSGSGEAAGSAALTLYPGTPNILKVSASSAIGLERAAAVLSDATHVHQLKGKSKYIREDDEIYVTAEDTPQYTVLTDSGTYVDGAFRQKADFYIDFPNNRQLAYGSTISLDVRYSKNLDFDRSLVTVYINDIPIGSSKLTMAQADGHSLELEIPTDIDVTGSFTVTVAFDLEIPDLWCTLRQSETPWAYITDESMIKFSSVETPYYLFEEYPYPFVSNGAFNDMVLLLPDEKADVSLASLGKFMLTMGQFLNYNTGSFTVVRAGDTGDLSDKNIVAIGTYQDNAFIASLNDQLFFRYDDNGEYFLSNEKLLIDPEYGATLSAAQLLDSPYASQRKGILVLSACNAEDLDHVLEQFGDTTTLWSVYGDGFVTDGSDLSLYRFKEDNELITQPTQTTQQKTAIVNLLLIAGMVVLLLIIGSAFLIIRYRRRKS